MTFNHRRKVISTFIGLMTFVCDRNGGDPLKSGSSIGQLLQSMTTDTQLVQRILDPLPNRSSTDSAQLAAAIRPVTKTTRDRLVRGLQNSFDSPILRKPFSPLVVHR